MSLRIAVSGATGRMGHALLGLADRDPKFEIVGALEAASSPLQGKPLFEAVSGVGRQTKISVTSTLTETAVKPRVLIDFTQPEGTLAYLKEAQKLGVGLVIGTTGFSDAQKSKIRGASKKIPIVMSANMSAGMNLLFVLVEEAAAQLGESYDVEIIEAHHRFKKDAPSGSALSLGESVARAWKVNLKDVATHGREGKVGERRKGTIGFHAVRGGDIVGEHTVLYAGSGERLELKHVAQSREALALGALKAALFLAGKKSGFFDMRDVLGLRPIVK
jgi:4-hydroxy-tetrahydrodipicolinate reductase